MRTVLIIDDEEKIRILLSKILSLEGFEVLQAADCKTGLKRLETAPVEAVLCDVKLPDGSGVDLIKKIKEKHPEVEIILLTAYGNIADGVQAIKNGAFDYITKGDDNNKMISDLEIIKAAYPLPLDFKTGEKYQYCNLAYYMLAQIITQVSGMPWQEYIKEKIFIPAGMKNTGMTDFYLIIPNRASGYMHKNGMLVNAEAMYAVRPSGGFLSTSSDMILWDKILREKNSILKKEHWELLWKPFIKTSDKPESKAYYAFGWIVDERNGHKVIEHGGANIGFRSYYSRFVNDDLSIIILTNTDEANPALIVSALSEYYFRNN